MKCAANPRGSIVHRKVDEMVELAVKYYTACFALLLKDKYGWSNDRVRRLLKDVMKQAEMIREGYLKYEDVIQTLKDDYDFELEIIPCNPRERRVMMNGSTE